MLDHVSFGVSDLARSAAFYDAALEPLGLVRIWTATDAVGYGQAGKDDCFAIKAARVVIPPNDRTHVAFAAPTADAARHFYKHALAHGGADDGGVGLCPEYGGNYFAAFIRDPDGYRIEAVCHSPN